MTFHERRRKTLTPAPAGPAPRFKVGERVCVVGGVAVFVTISAIIPGKHTNRYRVEGGTYMHFESDLTEVPA